MSSELERTSCCVVGGGPAGAVLSLLLARNGVPVTLLEGHKDFDREGDQGIPLIDDHRELWVEVTINRARLPVMASDRQHMLPSLQRRADADRGKDGSR